MRGLCSPRSPLSRRILASLLASASYCAPTRGSSSLHSFSSERIVPGFQRYQDRVSYVAISDADRHPELRYAATIHHGIALDEFPFDPLGSDDLLFFGRIHPDKGAAEAIEVARRAGR